MKPWYKSRTLWFNVFVSVIGLFAGLVPEMRGLFTNPLAFTVFAFVVGVVNIVLRMVTEAALAWQSASEKK